MLSLSLSSDINNRPQQKEEEFSSREQAVIKNDLNFC